MGHTVFDAEQGHHEMFALRPVTTTPYNSTVEDVFNLQSNLIVGIFRTIQCERKKKDLFQGKKKFEPLLF